MKADHERAARLAHAAFLPDVEITRKGHQYLARAYFELKEKHNGLPDAAYEWATGIGYRPERAAHGSSPFSSRARFQLSLVRDYEEKRICVARADSPSSVDVLVVRAVKEA